MRVGSAGGGRSAAVVAGAVAAGADVAAVVAELLGRLERTVSQRWPETDFDGVVVEIVGWAEGCEGLGGGGVGRREVGRTGWAVVQGT